MDTLKLPYKQVSLNGWSPITLHYGFACHIRECMNNLSNLIWKPLMQKQQQVSNPVWKPVIYNEYPNQSSSGWNLFWRMSICHYLFMLSIILFSLYTREAVFISRFCDAVNLAPEVGFSISKFQLQRNFGSITLIWQLWPPLDRGFEVIFFMAWNTVLIETSISCPKKSVSFLYGSRRTSFRPFICPLSITGLMYRSGCLFSWLEVCYHISWVMNVILYRLSISLLKKYSVFWSYWYGMWLRSPFYLESVLEA